METYENELILSFDTLYTTNHIQIMKVLLPYFDPDIQKKMAIMIKYLEFQYTLDYFRKNPELPGAVYSSTNNSFSNSGKYDIVDVFSQIKSFCTPSERAMFDQLYSLKKNMDMYEEMMNMMQLFKDLSPQTSPDPPSEKSGNSSSDASNIFAADDLNPMDLLKNMLSPEQQAMFDAFSTMLPNNSQ